MMRIMEHARALASAAAMAAGLTLAWIGTASVVAQDTKPVATAFDLAFVPNDAPVVLAFRPAALLKMPDLKALYTELTADEQVKRMIDVAEPETVEQITFVLLQRDIVLQGDPGEALARAGAIIVRTNKAREWKALAAAGGVPLVKASHGGKDYYKATADALPGFGFFQPDEKTLVIASETNLQKLMDGGKSDAPKPSRWREMLGGSDTPIAVAAVDFAWLRNLASPHIKAEKGVGLALSVIGPIWEKTNDAVIAVSANEKDGVTLTADLLCADEEGADRVLKTIEAFLTLGQNVAPQGLRVFREQTKGKPLAAEMADIGEQAAKSAKVTKDGLRVRLTVTAKANVAKFVREAVKR